jgi:hypothetical protein
VFSFVLVVLVNENFVIVIFISFLFFLLINIIYKIFLSVTHCSTNVLVLSLVFLLFIKSLLFMSMKFKVQMMQIKDGKTF